MSDDCVASLDALDKPLTVFSPWYFYDDATMRLWDGCPQSGPEERHVVARLI